MVERAAHRQLLVVEPVGVDRRARVARQPAEHDDRAAWAYELDRVDPRGITAGSLEHEVRARARPALGTEQLDEPAPLRPAADDDRPAVGVGDAGRAPQAARSRTGDRAGRPRPRP